MINAVFLFLLVFLQISCLEVSAAGIPAPPTADQLHKINDGGSADSQGDYISPSGTPFTNKYYSYFIEVPPGVTQMSVQVFDADFGAGGGGDLYDYKNSNFDSTTTYTLFNPSGVAVAAQSCTKVATAFCADATWSTLNTTNNPAAGHWEFRVAATGTGNDTNGFAVRAFVSSGSVYELNMYAYSFAALGPYSGSNTYNSLYPYITSGCTANSKDFDWDSSGAISFFSRAGVFTQNNPAVSGDNAWLNTSFSGWTTDFSSADYGIWSSSLTLSSGFNVGTFYLGNYANLTTPPTTQPQANTFRMYLPTDAGAAPVKPFVTQTLAWRSGPNPPVAGSTTRVQVDVNVFNPTPWAITFSAANLVTANVPGGGVVYTGSANTTVSQGSITAQPGAGGTGNITWNPGTVAAGTTAKLTYQVDVTPPGAARVPVTATPASGNGTRAVYVDETGNTTQALATYTFGPLCELAVTAGTALPTLAVISSFRSYESNGQAVVEWSTSSETDTAGYHLYRLDEAKGKYRQVNHNLLPALLTSSQGGTYSLIDGGASLKKANTYLLVEIEGKGTKNSYGPYTVQVGGAGATGSAENLNTPNTAGTEQFSGYTRKPHGMSAEKKARIQARKASKEQNRFLKKTGKGSMIKISVEREGLYYMDSQEIASLLGIPQSRVKSLISGGELAINSQGSEVAYTPSDDSSGIFFYGQGIESIYTKENIYWLYRGRGLLMEQIEGSGPLPAEYKTFAETRHIEEDRFAVTNSIQDPETDYWFWEYIYAVKGYQLDTKTFTLKAEGLADLHSYAVLALGLKGFTASEHHVIVRLNGNVLTPDVPDSASWSGTDAQRISYTFSQDMLYEGDNTVDVEGIPAAGEVPSIFFIDSFDIIYQRTYEAKDNSLVFRGDGNTPVTVDGFTSPDIFVFDISDPYSPKFNAAATINGSAGNYSISFVPSSPDTPYLAITADAAIKGFNAWADSPSKLSSKNNIADYIIITTEELADAARSYAGYRQSRGLQTMVVMLEDIMDEFNYGISSPKAIHDFLSHAYRNWSNRPRYVLLAGEGTYDYKDNLGYADNLIPVKMVATPFGLFPSDNYFADVDGDLIPDMAIGRFSVSTVGELNNMLNKIMSYEPGRMKKMLWVADNPDEAGDFVSDSNEIAGMVPRKYPVEKIYLSDYPLDTARQLLLDGINNGALFLNYTGHGAADRLAGEGLLMSSDVNSLTNGNRLPVVTAMTCVAGNFAFPGYDSLSEALVSMQNGGSIAFFGPSGMALNHDSKELAKMFYQGIFTEKEKVLGDAVIKAFAEYKALYGGSYLLYIYNLQGDPALKLW